MRRMGWLALLVLAGCDDGSTSGGGVACEEAELARQCPPNSQPIVGTEARRLCEAGAEVQGAEGEVTGRCYSESSCQVACRFEVPCRCGVDRITADGVFCTPCEGAAACGDGVCAGGENPESCAEDCGPRCSPGQQRCNGVLRQECSLQGRFENLACPAGEVCEQVALDQVDCRAPGVEVVDAGPRPPDGSMEQPWIAGGRARRGPGTWPGSSDGVGPGPAGMMRFLYQSTLSQGVTYGPGLPIVAGPGATVDALYVCGTAECQRYDGWAHPASADVYCSAYALCSPEYEEACRSDLPESTSIGQILNYAYPYGRGLLYGAPAQACVLRTLEAGGECLGDLRSLGCPGPGQTALAPGGFVQSWVLSPSGRFAAFVTGDAQLELGWGPLDGAAPPQIITLGMSQVVSVDVSDAGVLVAVLFDGSSQILLSAPAGEAPSFRPLDGATTQQVLVSPSGRVVALADMGNLVRFWNVADGEEILRIRDSSWPVAFSPVDGVVGLHFTQGGAELWDVVAIEKLGELPGVVGAPYAAMAFDPSGAFVATASGQAVQFWETATRVRTGQDLLDPRYLQGPFMIHWAADGQGAVVRTPYRLVDPTLQPMYRFYVAGP